MLINTKINFNQPDSDHIEMGAAPIRVKEGWLLVYSYIRNYFRGNPTFEIRAVLLDAKKSYQDNRAAPRTPCSFRKSRMKFTAKFRRLFFRPALTLMAKIYTFITARPIRFAAARVFY